MIRSQRDQPPHAALQPAPHAAPWASVWVAEEALSLVAPLPQERITAKMKDELRNATHKTQTTLPKPSKFCPSQIPPPPPPALSSLTISWYTPKLCLCWNRHFHKSFRLLILSTAKFDFYGHRLLITPYIETGKKRKGTEKGQNHSRI